MKRGITRRDFLNGAAVSIAAGAGLPLGSWAGMAAAAPAGAIGKGYYPPVLTGMRGSHAGSFEVAHALAWRGEKPGEYAPLSEKYDLVVVGGGLSGLTAAHLFRQRAGADKKVLILDNHDDFGGHAKRNEFHTGERMWLSPGGSINLETMNFSDNVNRVLDDLGVDFEKLQSAMEPGYFLSDLGGSTVNYFLNADDYGSDRVVAGRWLQAWLGEGDVPSAVAALELPGDQAQRLVALIEGERDLLDDLSIFETMDYIRTTPYRDFLKSRAGLSDGTIGLFEPMMNLLYCTGIECASVAEALALGSPGMKSMGLTGKIANRLFAYASSGIQFPMFPDGNASVARLLVRRLIPEVAPGNTMEDVIDARFDYSQLDREEGAVRLRLNSTAVQAANVDGGVEISYVQGGNGYSVRGEHCILACYNGLIPHLCPELPEAQKEHLRYGVKAPMVQVAVLLRSGSPVSEAGSANYMCPGSFYSALTKAPPVELGNYSGVTTSENGPMLLCMFHVPAPRREGEQSARDLYRLGRHTLYRTPFATFEAETRKQLTAMFGPTGFDADRDIEAITVNRWSHGYAYEYMQLFDPTWEDGQAPHELGRKPIGRISIANSDSEASAYLHAAIDAAHRAVEERLAG